MGLGEPAVRVGRLPQLPGEAELAERAAGGRAPPSSPCAADASARAIARSAPGSSTRTPPAIETKTSLPPRRTPPWRARTARMSASRLRSTPLATRRGGESSLGATSAWTSTSSGREPSIAQSTTRARGVGGLGHEAGRGVLDLHQAAVAHLEHADLAGRAEAVLERAERPVGALALALEAEHAVHQVLEHARPRDRALLRHVTHEHHRRAALLGDAHEPPGDLAHLPDRPRRPRQRRVVEHLHRVDHAGVGPLGLDGGHDASRSVSATIGTESAAGPSRSARSLT